MNVNFNLTYDILFKQFEHKYLKYNPNRKERFTKLWQDVSEKSKVRITQSIDFQPNEKVFLCSEFPIFSYYGLNFIILRLLNTPVKWIPLKNPWNVWVILTNYRIIFKSPFSKMVFIPRKEITLDTKHGYNRRWKQPHLFTPIGFKNELNLCEIILYIETPQQMIALDHTLSLYFHPKFNHL